MRELHAEQKATEELEVIGHRGQGSEFTPLPGVSALAGPPPWQREPRPAAAQQSLCPAPADNRTNVGLLKSATPTWLIALGSLETVWLSMDVRLTAG